MAAGAATHRQLVVGGYTELLPHVKAEKPCSGLTTLSLNLETGAFDGPAVLSSVGPNPSWVASHDGGKAVLVCCESMEHDGKPTSTMVVMRSGGDATEPMAKMTEAQRLETAGTAACYCEADRCGTRVAVANYMSGSIALFQAEGSRLRPATATAQHGDGFAFPRANAARQEGPHAHQVRFHPNGNWLYAADLGTDELVQYRVGASATLDRVASFAAPPGSGPRHMDFVGGDDPERPSHLVVAYELTCELALFAIDGETGALEAVARRSTLPDGVALDPSFTAGQVAAYGQFVYASTRGHDSLVRFEFSGGRLHSPAHTPTLGRCPRHFAIVRPAREGGRTWLVVANQDSSSVHSFELDAETGLLTASGASVEVPAPTCVLPL